MHEEAHVTLEFLVAYLLELHASAECGCKTVHANRVHSTHKLMYIAQACACIHAP
jgi:hypothetical protein